MILNTLLYSLKKYIKETRLDLICFRCWAGRYAIQDGLPVRGGDLGAHLPRRPPHQDHPSQLRPVQHCHLQQPRQDGPVRQLHGPLLNQGHEEKVI